MLTPRPYQQEALDAVNAALRDRDDNPAIVLPTGAGKSLVMALLIQRWFAVCPNMRVMVLAHRKELVEQNAEELAGVDSSLPIGVFSAALRRRDTRQQITFASIDSVAKRADDFPPQDVLLIDEAHRIPIRGEGKYRKFIDAMTARNPSLRIVGLTATPYRMGTGSICDKDYILNHICYEARIGDLIDGGYLARIRTVAGDHSTLDLKGVKKTAGEFNLRDLSLRVDRDEVVAQAVRDVVNKVRSDSRKSVIVFCINVEHCKHVARELTKYGISAPYIVGSTPIAERERLVEEFKAGRHQFMLSVDCFFEGFNAKRVDCVVMLRPTQSRGLWIQAVGRGLRLHPDKQDCLILDYGQNIATHGPIDLDDDGEEKKMATCTSCENVFSRALRKCPSCGTEIPPQQREMFEAEEERERRMHDARAAQGQLLAKPRWLDVSSVALRLHRKAGKPDSVRVEYLCGMTIVKEWLLLDHGSYGSTRAHKWLSDRGLPLYGSSAEMIAHCAPSHINALTSRILVKHRGKYLEIDATEIMRRSGGYLV